MPKQRPRRLARQRGPNNTATKSHKPSSGAAIPGAGIRRPRISLSPKRKIAALCLVSLIALTGVAGALTGSGVFNSKRAASNTGASSAPTAPSPLASGLTLSKEYIYAGGRLLATEEPVGPGPGCGTIGAPSLTTSLVNGVITLNWNLPSEAAKFEVQRGTTITALAPIAQHLPATTTSFQDTGISLTGVNPDGSTTNGPVVTYIYRVLSLDSTETCSQASNLDWATNINFAEALIPQQTLIRARHVTELRVAVNAVWPGKRGRGQACKLQFAT